MNDLLIEKLLSKAPAPKTPAELRDKLIAGIQLTGLEQGRPDWNERPAWFKRWFPGLAFAAFLLTCLVVVGVQVNQLSVLRRENDALRAHNQQLAGLRAANAEVRRLQTENAELDRLQKNSAEIQRLRNEIAQLRAQSEGLAELRAENQRLQAAAKAAPGARKDFFAEAQDRAERVSDVNNLKLLGVALRRWAIAHNGQFPADFASMTNEMDSWRILQCRGDKAHNVTSWAQVAAGDVSYQIYTAGLTDRDNPNIIVLECPVHHIFGLLDGSVQMMTEKWATSFVVKVINGRRVLDTSGNGAAQSNPSNPYH